MLSRLKKHYSPHEDIPLAGYAVAAITYNVLLFSIGRLSKRKAEISVKDMILAGIATHKLSRMITKDAVTSFVRAPFTTYQESLGYGEVKEKPRLKGEAEVISEIISCNYCMGVWVGLGMFWGLLSRPRPTRFLTRLFSGIAISDFLHVIYEEKRTRTNVLTLREEQLEHKSA